MTRSVGKYRWVPRRFVGIVKIFRFGSTFRTTSRSFWRKPIGRDMVSRALRQWTGIRTAEIDLTLEPGLVVPGASEDGTDANDGMFTIGWISSAEEDEEGGITLAYATPWLESVLARSMASCDIVVGGAFQKFLDEGEPREAVLQKLERSVLHEV